MTMIFDPKFIRSNVPEKKELPTDYSSMERYDRSMQILEFISGMNADNADLSHLVSTIHMESVAIQHLKESPDYKGILDVISMQNVDSLNKRLGITHEDLFDRTDAGIRDVYVSSLTEDVNNFIGNLWAAIKSSLQKTYSWSTNLGSENSTIDLCKKMLESVKAILTSKGNAAITCDMIDPEDWKIKAAECSNLLRALTELIANATQVVITGQLNEKSLQDQLLGMMQRANISQIKLVIETGPSSSSFQLPGVSSARVELKDTQQEILSCGQVYVELLSNLDNLNKGIVPYAQAIEAAQNQYKCNTNCAAVVSNISSASAMITKAIVAVDSYILGTISESFLDILKKIEGSIGSLPEAQPVEQPPAQQ